MSPADRGPHEAAPTPPAPSALTRGASAVVLVLLVGFIAVQLRTLTGEWSALKRELAGASRSTVIGYEAINPNPCYAQRPPDWVHDEADATLLWAGWRTGRGHLWFRIGRGELDLSRISLPMGRDVVQAIDWPLLEVGGGEHWGRIPPEHQVVGLTVGGTACVYPMIVLRKVEVINDRINGQPVLISYTPFHPDEEAIDAFDPRLDGRRLTLGSSGYFDREQQKPLLYDRGTESLWLSGDAGLEAVAGPLRGAHLKRLSHLKPVTWGTWRSRFPRSRLVVGADRSHGLPDY